MIFEVGKFVQPGLWTHLVELKLRERITGNRPIELAVRRLKPAYSVAGESIVSEREHRENCDLACHGEPDRLSSEAAEKGPVAPLLQAARPCTLGRGGVCRKQCGQHARRFETKDRAASPTGQSRL
jgi:hypothetical protein